MTIFHSLPPSVPAAANTAHASADTEMMTVSSRTGNAAWLDNVPEWRGVATDSRCVTGSAAGWASVARAIGRGLGSLRSGLARAFVLSSSNAVSRGTQSANANDVPMRVIPGQQTHSDTSGVARKSALVKAAPSQSIAEVCAVLKRGTPDSDILLLKRTGHELIWSIESPDNAAAAEALAAVAYLDENVQYVSSESLVGDDGNRLRQATAGDLRRLADDAYREFAEPVLHALGPSHAPRDDIPRMPTEIVIEWADALQRTADGLSDGSQRTLVMALLSDQQARWMTHDLDIDSTRQHLRQDSDRLRKAGLASLADFACSTDGSSGLAAQLPVSSELDPVAARLHDNPYGRVFESAAAAWLVENSPASMLATMQALGRGLARLIDETPSAIQSTIVKVARSWVREDPRFWFDATPDVAAFAREKDAAKAANILRRLLNSDVENGYQAVAICYLATRIYGGLTIDAEALDKTDENYERNIAPFNGRVKNENRNIPLQISAGITLWHQPPADGKRWAKPTSRPSLTTRPEMTSLPEGVRRQLNHGIPYVSGVSGCTNMMLGIAAHLRDGAAPDISFKDILLATVMYLVFDGGHSIHESLWTANQRDDELRLGFNLSSGSQTSTAANDDLDPKTDDEKKLQRKLGRVKFEQLRRKQIRDSQFKADYHVFMDLYKGTESGEKLRQAFDAAWRETLRYFQHNSYFSH